MMYSNTIGNTVITIDYYLVGLLNTITGVVGRLYGVVNSHVSNKNVCRVVSNTLFEYTLPVVDMKEGYPAQSYSTILQPAPAVPPLALDRIIESGVFLFQKPDQKFYIQNIESGENNA